jgi:hypothetical protein
MFLVACGSVFVRGERRPPFFAAYRSFLTLFWMTAPLAWLYAIPYERFLPAGAATSANLWTLAFVAAWRVVLMVRVVSVITGRGWGAALFLVMLFADAVALTAVYFMPKPIIEFMGGIRLTQSEAAVAGAALTVFCLGILSAPFWLVLGLVAFFTGRPTWDAPLPSMEPRPSRGLWALAVASVLVWLPILPLTQSEQLLRVRAERDLKGGRIAEGLDLMSAHAQSDFPPHWDPPPRLGYEEKSPHLLDVMEVLAARDDAPWVRAVYLEKFRRYLEDSAASFDRWHSNQELGRIVRVLQQLPEGPEVAARLAGRAESRLKQSKERGFEVPAEEREHLLRWLELAGQPPPP